MGIPSWLANRKVSSVQFDVANGASAQELVAAVSGKRIKVVAFGVTLNAAADVDLSDNAGTPKLLIKWANVTDVKYGPEMFLDPAEPATAAGQALDLNVSGGVADGNGWLQYVVLEG